MRWQTVSEANLGDAVAVNSGRHFCRTRSLAERQALRCPLQKLDFLLDRCTNFEQKFERRCKHNRLGAYEMQWREPGGSLTRDACDTRR